MSRGSVYQQSKHKRVIGMVNAARALKCMNCGGLVASSDLFKGWCQSCLASWGRTADPSLVAQARDAYYTGKGEPPTARAYERLKDRIADRRPDEWFIPMTLYLGNYSIGQAQANWNYLQAMYELEVMSTSHAFKLGRESHDLLHLCGRHAPMQRNSLGAAIGRVINSPEVWRDVAPAMREYIQDFVSQQGGNFRAIVMPRARIARYARSEQHKVRRAWRRDPTYKSRRQIKPERQEWGQKWGGVIQPTPNFWPFAVRRAPEEHDMLHAIDALTRGIPEQWRQDVCQDLVVAVLSGEATLDNLRGELRGHLRKVFQMHPIKYGELSLDAPLNADDGRTLGEMIAAGEIVPDHHSHNERFAIKETKQGDTVLWHEGRNRPLGLATIGEILMEKNDGRLIDNFVAPPEDEIDREIAEVFAADQCPQGWQNRRADR